MKIFLLLLILAVQLPAAAPFRAGAATSSITPELGGAIIGGFSPFPSKHIHDELHARCLVLDDGQMQLALVVCDLLGADRAMYDEAARILEAEIGFPRAHLLASATHTHSATSALNESRFLKEPLSAYQLFVARRIADGVRRAIHNLAPARIGWATANEPREVFNRRWYMKPGTIPADPFGQTTDTVKMNPPRGSEDLVGPAGPTDPEICLLAVETPEGRPMALLANYSLHYVGDVGPAHISADYFAAFCDRMQELLGADRQEPPFVAMMSNGTSGNINNIDFRAKSVPRTPPYTKIRAVADRVATAALAGYRKIEWHDTARLGAQYRELELGVRHPTPEQLERARAILAKPATDGRGGLLERVYAERTVKISQAEPTVSVPLHLVRVGEVGIGGIPCETFVETGLEFKKRSPFRPSFIMSIAHGYYGYMPTPEQLKLGGYETWLGTNRLEAEAAPKILGVLLEMAAALR